MFQQPGALLSSTIFDPSGGRKDPCNIISIFNQSSVLASCPNVLRYLYTILLIHIFTSSPYSIGWADILPDVAREFRHDFFLVLLGA